VTARRTQDEIVARIHEVKEADIFGTQVGDLLSALDFEHAKEFLKAEATEAEWSSDPAYPLTDEQLRDNAKAYLAFAVGKATGHRGLSASRSVDHYRAWVWLLEPELFEGFEATPYEQYGVPQLKAAANILDFTDEWDKLVADGLMHDDRSLILMAEGKPCEPGCMEGCGS
jgi:hypothetical protein